MQSRPANVVARKVGREARATSRYLGRILNARDAGALGRKDVDRAFKGAYLDFYVLIEEQIEYLFYGVLMSRLRVSGARPKVQVRSEVTAKQLVLGGRPYADWLPIHHTIGRANVYLAQGIPFSRLDAAHQDAFAEMAVIRNAVAHSGVHAEEKFRDKVIQSRPIPVRERSPATYLAGLHAGSQTRMDELIGRASSAFAVLCA